MTGAWRRHYMRWTTWPTILMLPANFTKIVPRLDNENKLLCRFIHGLRDSDSTSQCAPYNIPLSARRLQITGRFGLLLALKRVSICMRMLFVMTGVLSHHRPYHIVNWYVAVSFCISSKLTRTFHEIRCSLWWSAPQEGWMHVVCKAMSFKYQNQGLIPFQIFCY